jgi:hypothetical protein
MTEIMRKLPKDLQREVWSFIGMSSFEMTPSARAYWLFIDDTENYGSGYDNFYGNDFKFEFIVGLKYFESNNKLYTEISNRNWLIFYKFIKTQNEINNYKYKHLDMKEVGAWIEDPVCECSHWLDLDDFRNREKYNWKCFNCYRIDNYLLEDDDILVDIQCRNCNEELSVKDFKFCREYRNGEDFWCSLCLEELEEEEEED